MKKGNGRSLRSLTILEFRYSLLAPKKAALLASYSRQTAAFWYTSSMKEITTVDEYIAHAPIETQERLEAIRAAIKEAAPDAEERISYKIPYYYYKGHLVYFGLNKKHIGLYALTKAVFKQFEAEVRPYIAAKGTIRLLLDEELPLGLIKKLVKAQVKENDKGGRNSRK